LSNNAEVSFASPRSRPWLFSAGIGVCVVALFYLALHLYADRYYGYFVDELYYLACSQHLDWGYVDQPPLIAVIAKLIRLTIGDSLSAIRLPAALAGAGSVVLTGAIARELGGGRFAQTIAALCAALAPGSLAINHYLSMNAFEPLFWMGCAYVTLRIIQTGNARLWIWFGVLAGFGLENKHSMLIFGFALTAALLLTRERRWLLSPWIWAAATIAFLLFLPNLWWNIQRHFPFLELQANIRRSGRDVSLSPVAFFSQEALAMLPLSVPIWIAGLWYFLFDREGRRFRFLGWAWLITAAIIVLMSPRIYYLFPAFPLLFAGGAAFWERALLGGKPRPWKRWSGYVYAGLMVAMGALLAPTLLPLLPPENYVRYSETMHLQQPRIETHELGPLPQLFADQFGWPEMAATVAGVYNQLPPDVRPRTAIFGQTYGQAGAIDFFGPRNGLPPAISGHQSYFLWGPRGYDGDSMIVLDDRQERLEKLFREVRKVAHVTHPYSMPYEHFDVFYCTGIREPLATLWPKLKNWD
jgi:4-amino-4-deoxy-L-arabinose transferase-like glycosyltransferase